MEEDHSITFNNKDLKCLKENLFQAVYIYLLLHPNEMNEVWIKTLRNEIINVENYHQSVSDVCRIFVYETLMFPSNLEDIIEMLRTQFPPIDEFFSFSTAEDENIIMTWKKVVIDNHCCNVENLFHNGNIQLLLRLIMKEMEKIIEHNEKKLQNVINLWYDWNGKNITEFETLEEVQLLTTDKYKKKRNDSFSETLRDLFDNLEWFEEKYEIRYITENLISVKKKIDLNNIIANEEEREKREMHQKKFPKIYIVI